MFFLSLPFALITLGAALWAARPHPKPVRWGQFLVCGAIATCLTTSSVVVSLFVLLAIALVVWQFTRQWVRMFLPLSAVAVAIPYGCVGWEAKKYAAEHDRLRQEYPFESITDQLPEPRAALRAPPAGEAATQFSEFENQVTLEAEGVARTYRLKQLHDRSVNTFVNNPGFGQVRMAGPRRITAESLKDRSERPETPSQPGSPAIWGEDDPFESTTESDRGALRSLHAGGLLDFVNPQGWGYVKDRDRVAGFLSHRFSKVPEAETWRVQRIELVGLLKHPEPVVYLSDRLPAMAELRDAPTRPLDKFEVDGLESIRKGEDGFAARRRDEVRFVGAIRSAKQCVDCHGGARGDLLGAFSYILRKAPAPS